LADDLQRFLEHRPILARATPWWEQTIKWARRRPAVAALLATLAVTLTGALIGMFFLWRQAEDERDDAIRARNEKESQRLIALKNQKEAEDQRNRGDKN